MAGHFIRILPAFLTITLIIGRGRLSSAAPDKQGPAISQIFVIRTPCRRPKRHARPGGSLLAAHVSRSRLPLTWKIHQRWRTWRKPLICTRIRLHPLNPAVSGHHARRLSLHRPCLACHRSQASRSSPALTAAPSRPMAACWRCVRSRSASASPGASPPASTIRARRIGSSTASQTCCASAC